MISFDFMYTTQLFTSLPASVPTSSLQMHTCLLIVGLHTKEDQVGSEAPQAAFTVAATRHLLSFHKHGVYVIDSILKDTFLHLPRH